jgi:hypothetical protein
MIWRHATQSLKYGSALALCVVSTVASATMFSSFLQYESGQDALIRGDGYPGQMKLVNHRNEAICVYFRYKNDQGEVLRLSKMGNKIPANRQDLAVTGPGVNARSLEIAIDRAQDRCGSFTENDSRPMLGVRAGEVKNGNRFEVDARTWSGNSRDITIHIR